MDNGIVATIHILEQAADGTDMELGLGLLVQSATEKGVLN
jgi:hypothetical protein